MKKVKRAILLSVSCMALFNVQAQLKVLSDGSTTIGGGNSPFPYTSTKLSINGTASLKSSIDIMNLNNANTGWGAQLRFTRNNLTGINHTIVDNGVDELILYPGFSNATSARHVLIAGGLNVSGYSALAGGGYFSDGRLKTNIVPLEGSLEKVMRLRGVQYTWAENVVVKSGDQSISLTEGLPKGPQIGFIAQEVEKVLPEVVKETSLGYKALEYHTLTALLVNAIQEQQAKIEELSNRLREISEQQANGSSPNVEEVRLGQNYPNPFNTRTVIEYDLPEKYRKAELYVTTLQGEKIIAISLEAGMQKKVEISSEQLKSGIYLYSLVSEGTVLTSRQFVISK
ncbi:hypothetical protein D3C87_11420 [compost metagenome]